MKKASAIDTNFIIGIQILKKIFTSTYVKLQGERDLKLQMYSSLFLR